MKYSTASAKGSFEADIVKTELNEYSSGFTISYYSSDKRKESVGIHGDLIEYEVVGDKIKVTYVEKIANNIETEISRIYFGPADLEWETVYEKKRKIQDSVESNKNRKENKKETSADDKLGFWGRLFWYVFVNFFLLLWNYTIGLIIEPFKIEYRKF